MGTWGVNGEEFLDKFEKLLKTTEGDVSAHSVAWAWNKLARRHKWPDRLKARYEKGA